MIVQALKALGRERIDESTMQKLDASLAPNERNALLEETQHGTAWIHEIVKRLIHMQKQK